MPFSISKSDNHLCLFKPFHGFVCWNNFVGIFQVHWAQLLAHQTLPVAKLALTEHLQWSWTRTTFPHRDPFSPNNSTRRLKSPLTVPRSLLWVWNTDLQSDLALVLFYFILGHLLETRQKRWRWIVNENWSRITPLSYISVLSVYQ